MAKINNYKEFAILFWIFLKKLKGYSTPLFQGETGSADVVKILFDHGFEFQHIRYHRKALEESIRRENYLLTKILRQMKIHVYATGIACVIYLV